MAIPSYEAFMSPVVARLTRGACTLETLTEHVSDVLALSPQERAERFSWSPEHVVHARVRMAAKDLEIAGLVETIGSLMHIAPARRAELDAAMPDLSIEYLMRYAPYAAHREEESRRQGA